MTVFGSTTSGAAEDFTLKGLRLGMNIEQALREISPDLRPSARSGVVTPPRGGALHMFHAGDYECGWQRFVYEPPCSSLRAISSDLPPYPLVSITLSQRFARPIAMGVFEERVLSAFGQSTHLSKRDQPLDWELQEVGGRSQVASWLWRSPAEKLDKEQLEGWIRNPFWLPQDVDKIRFAHPALRVDAYVTYSGGEWAVVGIQTVLFDQRELEARNKRGEKYMEIDRKRGDREVGQQIQLR